MSERGPVRAPNRAEVRSAALGRGGRLERGAAFGLLLRSDDPEREALLASVANDTRETPQERSAAVIALGHISTPKAEQLLRQMLATAPLRVLPDVLRSLGRIGSPAAIDAIDASVTSSVRPVADAARFAASLIAYRYRLPGHDLPIPPPNELLAVPSRDARPMDVGAAPRSEARAALASLVHEPYGIELAPGSLTQLRCGTDLHVLCVNREFVVRGAASSLLERKALLALAALQSREGDGYSVSYILLSTPSPTRDTIGLLAPRCTGHPALAGSAELNGDRLRLTLRSVDRPGARPLAIDGTLELGRVTILEAVVAARRKRAPAPATATPG
jgi:hypothetical protein